MHQASIRIRIQAVREFRHQVIFGSLVPPRPLSQRRFDNLGRIVVSVVGRT